MPPLPPSLTSNKFLDDFFNRLRVSLRVQSIGSTIAGSQPGYSRLYKGILRARGEKFTLDAVTDYDVLNPEHVWMRRITNRAGGLDSPEQLVRFATATDPETTS